jgi:RecA-family ATPase
MFPIFPITITNDGRKVPLIKNWTNEATNDQEKIKLWSELFRDRLTFFGVPTGHATDLLVLDLDVKHNAFEHIQRLGLSIPQTAWQRTRSGGAHFLFKYPKNGQSYGNRANLFGSKENPTGIDVRGEGGYIVYYGTTFGGDLTAPICEAPDWLLSNASRADIDHSGATVTVSPEVAQEIILKSLDAIREAAPGESNDTLNREGFRIGQLIAAGSVSRQYAEEVLLKAAIERGKPVYEAKATIKSCLDGAALKPLVDPFGGAAPVPLIQMQAPPEPPGRWTPHYLTMHDLTNVSKLRKPQLFEHWSTEDIHLTTADGGTGKTTLKLYEAVCLALGHRFLGFECKQSGKTLYITGEDSREKLAALIGAICKQMGLMEPGIENRALLESVKASVAIKKDSDMCLVTKDKQGFFHPNREAMNKIMEAVEDIKPKMIVFDPVASFWGSEAALNDMAKAVSKFMGELVERSGACVEMVNHMGKASSSNKDMSQFAGRGGSGLPSHSRVSRVLRLVLEEEYSELTGEQLAENQSAMLCNVAKFTDGSPLTNNQFLIIRSGFLFTRKILTAQKAKEAQENTTDIERVFDFVLEQRKLGRYPSREVAIAHFMSNGSGVSGERVKRALNMLVYSGCEGFKLKQIDNPDAVSGGKVFVVTDVDGREV